MTFTVPVYRCLQGYVISRAQEKNVLRHLFRVQGFVISNCMIAFILYTLAMQHTIGIWKAWAIIKCKNWKKLEQCQKRCQWRWARRPCSTTYEYMYNRVLNTSIRFSNQICNQNPQLGTFHHSNLSSNCCRCYAKMGRTTIIIRVLYDIEN